MSHNSGRTITYAKLHGGDAFVPGVGGLGNTLPTQSKTLNNFQMFHTDNGVLVTFVNLNKRYDVVIPWANVQVAVYGPANKVCEES